MNFPCSNWKPFPFGIFISKADMRISALRVKNQDCKGRDNYWKEKENYKFKNVRYSCYYESEP